MEERVLLEDEELSCCCGLCPIRTGVRILVLILVVVVFYTCSISSVLHPVMPTALFIVTFPFFVIFVFAVFKENPQMLLVFLAFQVVYMAMNISIVLVESVRVSTFVHKLQTSPPSSESPEEALARKCPSHFFTIMTALVSLSVVLFAQTVLYSFYGLLCRKIRHDGERQKLKEKKVKQTFGGTMELDDAFYGDNDLEKLIK